MVSLHAETEIAAPVDLVYRYVTDWDNAPRFVVGLKSWRPLDTGDLAVGSRFAAKLGAAIGSVSGELEIVRFEPGAYLGWEGRSGPDQTGSWSFTALSDSRTLVRFELAYTPRLRGPVGRALNKTVESVVQTTLTQSGKRLREQVEALAGAG